MNNKEVIKRTIKFETPDRMGVYLPDEYGNDFRYANMNPHPDARHTNGIDEWGCRWEAFEQIGNLGEVKNCVLEDWADFDKLLIPDVLDEKRWGDVKAGIEENPDKFTLAFGIALYERAHFLRGLENLWMDILLNPDELEKLLDVLVDMNIQAIEKLSTLGIDGYFILDDWGLQDRLMISPEKWRELWKPRYEKVFSACHKHKIQTFMHSCGYIVDILDDLIEVGLDVIQMDQQENMGLDLLGEKFKGKITFFCPVDIQNTMVHGTTDDVRRYCREMFDKLGDKKGGFIPKFYDDYTAVGHSKENIKAMCEEFLQISKEIYRK